MTPNANTVGVNLIAIIVTLVGDDPAILRIAGNSDVVPDLLPSGPFIPSSHKTLTNGLKHLLISQIGLGSGNFEQLFTEIGTGQDQDTLDIGYLALTTNSSTKNTALGKSGARWKNWYAFLPWEDWRAGRPPILDDVIIPYLLHWANTEGVYTGEANLENATSRIKSAFGMDDTPWQVSRIIERFDLMNEAGLLAESDRVKNRTRQSVSVPVGVKMASRQRHMLAVAIGRLRNQIQHIPVVRDLMEEEFTLTQLQKCAEGILGRELHKQNFRRQIENLNLVEKSGAGVRTTGGRPASLYRFCKE